MPDYFHKNDNFLGVSLISVSGFHSIPLICDRFQSENFKL